MKFQKLKKSLLMIILLCIFSAGASAEDTIWNRVFFQDFQDIGSAVIARPEITGLVAVCFGAATYGLMKNDLWLSQSVKSIKNKFYDTVFDGFNELGDGMFVLAADSVFFACGGEKGKKAAQSIVEGIAVSGAISYAGKVIFGRLRPSATDNPLAFHMFNFADNSYPSGHTTVAFVCATIIGDRYDIGWITYPAAALTGAARIYKNAHWPSDVLLGAVIGVVTGKIINNEIKDVNISANPAGISLAYNF
jgi:membrane-associated phospholipid phosphatase